jgi:hypothetical protein
MSRKETDKYPELLIVILNEVKNPAAHGPAIIMMDPSLRSG